MRVVPCDTVIFGYITQIVGEGRTDTLGIFSADTVKLFADSTIVGWNVSFADYNTCLETWNEKMDMFVALNCATFDRIPQGSPSSWADSSYLWARDTNGVRLPIRKLGCALTSMAMIGQAFGIDVNPLSLNNYMRDQFEFSPGDSAKVKWWALDSFTPEKIIRYQTRIGRGYRGPNNQTVPLTTVDSLLSRCQPMIAEVFNRRTGNPHWVIIKEKTTEGRYAIADPGGNNSSYLDDSNDWRKDYRNRIYRLEVYTLN